MSDIKNEVLLSVLAPFVLLGTYTERSLRGALLLNQALREFGLTVVTAESLTAGMIAKTLIDVASFGSNLYGGFVVYDTSAKRQWLGVNTPSVYSSLTAEEMAIGALGNSRALVALAVTGNSQPYPTHADAIGIVDMGLALRIKPNAPPLVFSKRVSLCELDPRLAVLCGNWKEQAMSTSPDIRSVPVSLASSLPEGYRYFTSPLYDVKRPSVPHFSTIQTTSQLSELLRLQTVAEATTWAARLIRKVMMDSHLNKEELQKRRILKCMPWDSKFTGCDEPSWGIRSHLNLEDPSCAEFRTRSPKTPSGGCCGVHGPDDYSKDCPRACTSSQCDWTTKP